MKSQVLIVLGLCGALGCASPKAPPSSVLPAPTGSPSDMVVKLEEGNRLFVTKDYARAEQSYRQTIAAHPTLAEAHYNLAVTLDQMGNRGEAKKHYMEAANLAPGNKVIWDSPPFRETGLTYDINKKSFLDANPHAQ
jgi:tetratricopeptide (TPR) repeat protein